MLRFLIGLVIGVLLGLGFAQQIQGFLAQQVERFHARTVHEPGVTITDAGMLEALVATGWSIESSAPFTLTDAGGVDCYRWCYLVDDSTKGGPIRQQVLVRVTDPAPDLSSKLPREPASLP